MESPLIRTYPVKFWRASVIGMTRAFVIVKSAILNFHCSGGSMRCCGRSRSTGPVLQPIEETAFSYFVHETAVDVVFGTGAARFRRRQSIEHVLDPATLRDREVTKRFRQPFVESTDIRVAVAFTQN